MDGCIVVRIIFLGLGFNVFSAAGHHALIGKYRLRQASSKFPNTAL